MGIGFIDEDKVKVERAFVLVVIASLFVHFFSKYSAIGFDTAAFIIFTLMCFAGFMAFKTAKEIAAYIEEQKVSYETSKVVVPIHDIIPSAYRNNNSSKFSKFTSSSYTKHFDLAK